MKIWTEEEITFLQENYTALGGRECSKLLNRSYKSVNLKASRLGLKRKNEIAWTEEEDRILQDNYSFLGPKTAELLPRRSKESVVVRATQKFNLKAPNRVDKTPAEYEQELLDKELEYWTTIPYSYVNSYTKISHSCAAGHQWLVEPHSILRGKGCPVCAINGFNPNKPAILYYIKLSDGVSTYYKIGITNNTLKDRFPLTSDREKIKKILLQKQYKIGQDAKDEELKILRKFKNDRSYCDFITSGNTEVFERDVLNLD